MKNKLKVVIWLLQSKITRQRMNRPVPDKACAELILTGYNAMLYLILISMFFM